MHFQDLGSVTFEVDPRLQWLWHSRAMASFIVGDQWAAYALPQDGIGQATRLEASRPFDSSATFQHPCNLPIPDALYDELRGYGWRGFRFLHASEYDRAFDENGVGIGDLLLTLVFGPDYGLWVSHQASGLVLGLRSGSMKLLRASDNKFTQIDEARTRGRAAMAFCAHPSETLVVYGDNYGNFHAHQFSDSGFGKAKKIATKNRNANTVQFIDANTLLIGGMGYLESYSYSGGKFTLLQSLTGPLRDFVWNAERKVLFVNQGLHGVAVYAYTDNKLSMQGSVTGPSAVNKMAVSLCGKYVSVSSQTSSTVTVFEVTFTSD